MTCRSWLAGPAGVFLTMLAALVCAGCVIQGQSSREMKEAMLDSFLFRSADIFYPDGVPEKPDQLPSLRPAQSEQVRKTYADLVAAIREQHAEYAGVLSNVFERPIASTLTARVVVTDTGQPVARLESNGDISIDIKVAQALYRGALLSGLQDNSLGGPRFMDARRARTSESDALREFFEMKKQVEAAPAHTVFGDFAGMFSEAFSEAGTEDWEKRGWFLMADYTMKSAAIEGHYIGQMRFLIAHELGHGALGHMARLRDIKPGDCEALNELELEADVYATILYALSTSQAALFDTGFGGGMFGVRTGAGFEDFFQYTYELAGFNTAAASSACGYPDPAVRQKRLNAVYEATRRVQAGGQWKEIEKKLEKDIEERGAAK